MSRLVAELRHIGNRRFLVLEMGRQTVAVVGVERGDTFNSPDGTIGIPRMRLGVTLVKPE
jgi:hypothetical protein